MHKVSQMKLDVLERFATSFRADYRFAPLNIMMLVGLCLLGLVIHLAVSPFSLDAVITMVGAAIVLASVFRIFQVWESVVVFTTGAALFVYLQHRPDAWILVTTVVVAGLLSPCIQSSC